MAPSKEKKKPDIKERFKDPDEDDRKRKTRKN
jgi:hypothetical protein